MPARREGVYDRSHTLTNYPKEMYINYAKSIGLAIERRCMDWPPRRPADFRRICEQEVNRAMDRIRTVSGTVRQMHLNKSQQDPDI